MKKIEMNLSQSSITNIINKLLELEGDLDKASKKITKDLSDITFDQVNKNYASSPYTDGNDDVSVVSKGTENHKKVRSRRKSSFIPRIWYWYRRFECTTPN